MLTGRLKFILAMSCLFCLGCGGSANLEVDHGATGELHARGETVAAEANSVEANSVAAADASGADELVDAVPSVDTAAIHVRPGEEIQAALDRAASDPAINKVVVYEGTYRPAEPRQALIWFNKQHDGIHLVADGNVTLTSANPDVANPLVASYPDIANHIVYFGDGVGPTTKIEGFRLTGSNNFVTTEGPVIEATDEPQLKRTSFFYFDGGAVKIFGRSYPTLERLQIVDNYSSPCGAGVSIEHRGFKEGRVTIRNCVFRNNRAPLTGAALDLLEHKKGSRALIENCLFVENASNRKKDSRSQKVGSWLPKVGHGAVTVFADCEAEFRNCTFTGNQNGVDDWSSQSTYTQCVFWKNTLGGGWPTESGYDADISNGAGVDQCFFQGRVRRRPSAIQPTRNVLDAPDPGFDANYVPRNAIYRDAGYRPAEEDSQSGQPADAQEKAAGLVPALPETLLVRARGSGYNWYFSYAGADGIPDTDDDIEVRRHLFLPTGRSVRIQLESDDYLYSLKLPAQGASEIAVPGMVHYCVVKEAKAGSYPLNGDQFCGYTHPDLIGRVVFESPNRFYNTLIENQIR